MDNIFYVIKAGNSDFYKFGVATFSRVQELVAVMNRMNPHGSQLTYSVKHSNPKKILKKIKSSILFHDEDWLIIDTHAKKELLKSLVHKEWIELNNKFWSMVCSGELKSFDEKELLKVLDDSIPFERKVLKFIDDNYTGANMMLTNQEIYNDLIEARVVPVEFSQRDLGRILKPRFKQSMKSIDGKNKRVYIFDE